MQGHNTCFSAYPTPCPNAHRTNFYAKREHVVFLKNTNAKFRIKREKRIFSYPKLLIQEKSQRAQKYLSY